MDREVYLRKMQKFNVAEGLSRIHDQWNPRIAGEINGQQVRIVKIQGHDFEMHHHPDDELFFVIKGSIVLDFEHQSLTLNEGEFCIVPAFTEHRPRCDEEAHLMMFVGAENVNTGNKQNEFTKESRGLDFEANNPAS